MYRLKSQWHGMGWHGVAFCCVCCLVRLWCYMCVAVSLSPCLSVSVCLCAFYMSVRIRAHPCSSVLIRVHPCSSVHVNISVYLCRRARCVGVFVCSMCKGVSLYLPPANFEVRLSKHTDGTGLEPRFLRLLAVRVFIPPLLRRFSCAGEEYLHHWDEA